MAANVQKLLLASAARTASVNTADQRNRYHRGVRIHIDATAAAATPSVVFTLQGKDEITGDYYDLLASAAVTATGDTFLLYAPGAATTANVSAPGQLPAVWRVKVAAADADSLTYALTAEMLI